ncbi:MAG: acyl carrier protein [Sedimentisphaerales bacterium]|nr:acyl carrier protein [Sedimentisphaerales bacterium]
MSYREVIRNFIVETFLFGEEGDLEDHTSFLESGIIDSTGILELITFLEETYGIKIQDDELIPDNLDSLQNVVAFLDKKVPCAG